MKLIRILFTISSFVFLGSVVLTSCKKDDFKPEEAHVRIYTEVGQGKKFQPLAIEQLEDDGYLTLSAFDGWNIFLMKTDALGKLVWSASVPSPYVNATPNLLFYQGNYYFVCMDEVGLFTYLMKIDIHSGGVEMVKSFSYLLYPTAAYANATSIFIQNYHRLHEKMGLNQLNSTLTDTFATVQMPINKNVTEEVVNHITFEGRRFPFFIQSSPNNDWIAMNGFFNHSFSLLFFDANLNFQGVYNGAAFDGGINAMFAHNSNEFSLGVFSNQGQYFTPKTTLSTSSINIVESISAQAFPELHNQKSVVVKPLTIDGKAYIGMIGSAKNNQLQFHLFDSENASLIATKYIGKNVPYSVCDMIETKDHGLMFLIQAKVFGFNEQIATIKWSDESLKEMVK